MAFGYLDLMAYGAAVIAVIAIFADVADDDADADGDERRRRTNERRRPRRRRRRRRHRRLRSRRRRRRRLPDSPKLEGSSLG